MVKLDEPEELTATLPKLTALALKEAWGADETALAVRLMTAGELPESPCTVSVPVIVPLAVGVMLTVKFPDCPEDIAIGNVMPLTLNCEFDTVACVTFMEAMPVFAIVTVWLLSLPTAIDPKFTVAGFN
jgi:hypothetical protein